MKNSVLIVSSCEAELMTLFGLLNSEYRVNTAKDAKEAVTILISDPAQAGVLVDINSLGVSWQQDIRSISKVMSKSKVDSSDDVCVEDNNDGVDLSENSIPLIVVCEHEDMKTRSDSLDSGASELLVKPYDSENLKKMLRQCSDVIVSPKEHDLIEDVPSGIASFILTEKRNDILYYNNACFNSLGYSKSEYDMKIKDKNMSLIYRDDRKLVRDMFERMRNEASEGDVISISYRCYAADGSLRWMMSNNLLSKKTPSFTKVKSIRFDMTEQKTEAERLRHSEEEYRLVSKHAGAEVLRFDAVHRSLFFSEDAKKEMNVDDYIEDVPYSFIREGKVSSTSSEAFVGFFERIVSGEEEVCGTFQMLMPSGWRWISAKGTTIFSESDKPVSAIISYRDVTEQQEKETVYRTWKQSIEGKDKESFSIFHINLYKNCRCKLIDGTLMSLFQNESMRGSFDDRTEYFAEKYVMEEDRAKFISFLKTDTLLGNFFRYKRTSELEFRMINDKGEIRWTRLYNELVQYPNSTDVILFMQFEDINERKLSEYVKTMRSNSYSTIGILNKVAFSNELSERLRKKKDGKNVALIAIDLSEIQSQESDLQFKSEKTSLVKAAKTIMSVMTESDIICRDGDGYFLMGIGVTDGSREAMKRANHISETIEKNFSGKRHLIPSIGVAMSPDDGNSFHTLYQKANYAMTYAKEHSEGEIVLFSKQAV